MGATSHILSTFARKPVFGYRAMVFAIFAIGMLGFFVWGHHMFMSGMSPYSAIAFSVLTLSIGVPSAIKTFNWLGHVVGREDSVHHADAFRDRFRFAVCGRRHHGTGAGADVARLLFPRHVLRDGALPSGDGRGVNLRHVRGHLLLVSEDVWPHDERSRSASFTFGSPSSASMRSSFRFMRWDCSACRAAMRSSTEYEFLKNSHSLVLFVTIAAIITVAAQVLFYGNFFWSMFKGKKASDNPWEATTLEWVIPSPPPHDNFAGVVPVVYHGPYEFSVPGAPNDFILQTEPEGGTVTADLGGTSGNGGNGHKA